MRVLLTGATGYAGRGIASVLAREHLVRGLDIRAAEMACQELVIGDLADLEVCRRALAGMEAMVLCHMAPNPAGYETPVLAMDVNVKGTANLYHSAVESGLRRAVLISSVGVLPLQPGARAAPGEGPYNFARSLYGLTKILQEGIARYYHDMHGMATAVLRPSWVVYDGDYVTKYGDRLEAYHPELIDPRDIGAAALAALALPDLALEAFQLGQDDSGLELTAARERLCWRPQHRFTGLPREPVAS